MAAKLLMNCAHFLCFKSCSVASAFARAPFVIAFLPAFIAFMGGSIALDRVDASRGTGDPNSGGLR